jgi:hypothetical protein
MTSIYHLKDPRTGYIFYVGSTKHPVNRLRNHISASKRKNCSRNMVYVRETLIRDILNSGHKPKMVVICKVKNISASLHERYWYHFYSLHNILLQDRMSKLNRMEMKEISIFRKNVKINI